MRRMKDGHFEPPLKLNNDKFSFRELLQRINAYFIFDNGIVHYTGCLAKKVSSKAERVPSHYIMCAPVALMQGTTYHSRWARLPNT